MDCGDWVTIKTSNIMEKTIYVWATDKFLSGWGCAEGKIHKQVAECPNWDEANRMLRGFESRPSEFKYVNWGYSVPRWGGRYTYTVRPSSEWTRFK